MVLGFFLIAETQTVLSQVALQRVRSRAAVASEPRQNVTQQLHGFRQPPPQLAPSRGKRERPRGVGSADTLVRPKSTLDHLEILPYPLL